MGNQDHQEIVDKINTLDEAKQLILQLLESQEAINYFLTYELRTPLLAIGGYAEIAQEDELAQDRPYLMKIIMRYTRRMLREIESIWTETRLEMFQLQESLLEVYPMEAADPNPILKEGISGIQINIDLENEIRVLANEINQRKDNAEPVKTPVNFSTKINENLPAVKINASMFDFVVSEIGLLLSDYYKDNIFILTGFDEEWVSVIIGYSTQSSLDRILDDFNQFGNPADSREFFGESALFYRIWKIVDLYGGKISLDIQDENEAGRASRLKTTIRFRRSQ